MSERWVDVSKKNVLVLLLLFLMLPSGFGLADETESTSQGDLGFTGIWEALLETDKTSVPPKSQDTNAPESVAFPNTTVSKTATFFPKTGEIRSTVAIPSLIGGMILLFVIAYEKIRRNKIYRKD